MKKVRPIPPKESALYFMADITGDIIELVFLFIMSVIAYAFWYVIVEPTWFIIKSVFKHGSHHQKQQPGNVPVGLHIDGNAYQASQAFEKSVLV